MDYLITHIINFKQRLPYVFRKIKILFNFSKNTKDKKNI